jgi:1-acyl-sn-glycerol-3-phosphate acyltransferase
VARTAPSGSRIGDLLANALFQALLCAQFLAALNITLIAVHTVGANGFTGAVRAAAVFAIPALAGAIYPQRIGERFSSARVLQAAAAFEIVVMLGAVPALLRGGAGQLLVVLSLLGVKSCLFTRAKDGMMAELLPLEQLSRGNGLLGLAAFAACAAGFLSFVEGGRGLAIAVPAIAGVEWMFTRLIRRAPTTRQKERGGDEAAIASFGLGWFWFAVSAMLLVVAGSSAQAGFLAAGIAIGSVAGGILSGEYIERGLIPAGSACMGVCALAAGLAGTSTAQVLWLAGFGIGAGLYAVPLNALLQRESGSRGDLATMAGVLAAAGLLWITRGRWNALLIGAATLAVSLHAMRRMPEASVRFVLWCTANLFFRIRIEGGENIPESGHALLVSNHISYADAVLVGCLARRRTIHFLMWQPIFDLPVANYFFRILRTIPIDAASPKSTVRALRAARAELNDGKLVAIFPEGEISRTGDVCAFERGFEKILQGSEAPVIPVRIEGLYGHPLSCKGGAPLQSWQKLWRPAVKVRVGTPIRRSISPVELRDAVVNA